MQAVIDQDPDLFVLQISDSVTIPAGRALFSSIDPDQTPYSGMDASTIAALKSIMISINLTAFRRHILLLFEELRQQNTRSHVLKRRREEELAEETEQKRARQS
jgi:hypothetical protein